MQERTIICTADGSSTIALQGNITYHSIYGAVQESMHVFINAGLKPMLGQYNCINIFELGLGTGLNALLTATEAIKTRQQIAYTCIEKFPLSQAEYNAFPIPQVSDDASDFFHTIHQCDWQQKIQIHPFFVFEKILDDLQTFSFNQQYHLIFFDAFDPVFQPAVWTEAIFKKMYDNLFSNGVLVTYSSKGIVRRALQAVGFTVEKLQGPPGKREIIRATKQ